MSPVANLFTVNYQAETSRAKKRTFMRRYPLSSRR
ncbi:hypothetical protein ELY38_01800 [Vreelandella nanhaiensis]|uniref:Uncharacterized protein n=1 Tax=Vreelandella nanhaiensis TaxID=1258546 RepID=A0A3S0Y7Y9_9GAMM|nr:hypothetical protein ELY38_01800 [Halomonas nanhaiensis]